VQTYVGHKKIKEFHIEGKFYDDSVMTRIRHQYENILVKSMRSRGYVPIFDIDSAFSTKYEEDYYAFMLTIYGIYIGKVNAKCYSGVINHKLIQ
jgi:hypothetical protein